MYRTDLALERTRVPSENLSGVEIDAKTTGDMEVTRVRIVTDEAAHRLGKARGVYWTLQHPQLPTLDPPARMAVAKEIARELRSLIPERGDVLVLGLGNRRMTADALGDRVVSGVLVTRHLGASGLRSVCALAPGVLGVTGIETAELAAAITERLQPACVIVVDALAAMETAHICTTVQITDTGITPGSGVGNHRAGVSRETLHVPVIALGVPMVVYTSTIVRDALAAIFAGQPDADDPQAMAEELSGAAETMVVTPRDVDETVQGLADLLALAINAALQPGCTMEELSLYLH